MTNEEVILLRRLIERMDRFEKRLSELATSEAAAGAVDSVNTQTGDVVLDADDIDDSATTNKFTTASDISKLAGIENGANAYTHPNHSGDVTSVGDAATTIANDAVTNAKAANMAQSTIKGRAASAGTGDPTDLTATQVRTILNVADGANAYTHHNHSGDVTSSGDGATTISNDVVTNAKLANMAQATVKGRASTAGTGDPVDLTATQLRAIANVEDGADVTDAGNVGSTIHGATAKTTPVDADTVGLIDSAASNVLKKLSWANIKATLKAYFDTVYGLYTPGTWTPVITGSGGNPSVTYSLQTGEYTRIGNTVFYDAAITVSAYSGGSGILRVSLPITAASSVRGVALLDGIDIPGTSAALVFSSSAGNAYGVIFITNDNAAVSILSTSAMAAGDSISVSGFYFV